MGQMDNIEFELFSQNNLDRALEVYRKRIGSDPLKEDESFPEQITALRNRTV